MCGGLDMIFCLMQALRRNKVVATEENGSYHFKA
jgi:hypothetical protein